MQQRPPSWTWRPPRVTVLLIALLAALFAVACGDAAEPSVASTPADATAAGAPEGDAADSAYLVVADPAEEALYLYGVPSGTLLSSFDHVILTAHTGTITLPDGRLLYVDGHENQLRVLNFAAEGGPRHEGTASIAEGQAWSAVDPDFQYYAGAARTETEATFTLIELDSLTSHDVVVPIEGEGEPHVALGGTPLTMYAYVGGDLLAFEVEEILHGHTEPAASLEVGAGAHSQAIVDGRLYTSLPERLHVVEIDGPSFGAVSEIPWNEGGRVGRLRLSFDGGSLQGALAAPVDPEAWADRQNDLWAVNLADAAVSREPLAPGIVGRASIAESVALYPNVHPEGDAAFVVDADPSSSTFGTVVRSIPLEPLGTPPTPGAPTTGTNSRATALTASGTWGFVSHGGDGVISVIDPERGEVTGTIETPSSLAGGGYLVAWEPGSPLVDLLGR